MMTSFFRGAVAALTAAGGLLVACGSNGSDGGAGGTSSTADATQSSASGPASSTSADASSGSGAQTGSGSSASGSGSGSGATTTSTTASSSASITVGALMSCGDAGLMDCFSSYECADDARCEDQGLPDAPVPCCVPGMRGPGLAGAMCAGEGDCYSSLCFEIKNGTNACTDTCTDLGDCPAPFESCNVIAGSGSNLKFCLP